MVKKKYIYYDRRDEIKKYYIYAIIIKYTHTHTYTHSLKESWKKKFLRKILNKNYLYYGRLHDSV